MTDRHALGKRSESDAALAELIQKYEREMAYDIAYVLAFRGEADRAFEWLDKAPEQLAAIKFDVKLPN